MTIPVGIPFPFQIIAPAQAKILIGGQAVDIIFGPLYGGTITNPLTSDDQGLLIAEPLYFDLVGTASVGASGTTLPLFPGETFALPLGFTGKVSVNAQTGGHKFSGMAFQALAPKPTPIPSTFPPTGPVTLQKIIPSYLFTEYNDDADLQALVSAYNTVSQQYLDGFNSINLPIYTQPNIIGPLLDWVADVLYGMIRPSLSSGKAPFNLGPWNTATWNQVPWNSFIQIGSQNVTATTDDIFKRIMTWNLYRGDGNVVNVRWLKRRITRFLFGANGTDFNIDQTYTISVEFSGETCNINLGSAQFAPVLAQAIASGAVLLPFQLTYNTVFTT